jgi:hypothetical protein
MGPTNWAFIALGFGVAALLLLTQGIEFAHAVLGVAALFTATVLSVILIVAWMGRQQVAELRVRGDHLQLEMLSPFGRGRKVDIPVAETVDWSLSRIWPTLRFRHRTDTYRLPLHGAILDKAALREIAPDIRQTTR